MKRGGGKRKGANFERKVCERLSRLISPDTDETLFWRSAMSGGRATVRQRFGKVDGSQAGDITSIHPDGAWLTEYFFIECKHHRDLNIQSALIDGRGGLAKFWRTAVRQARSHHREPMLIARENLISRTLLILSPKGKHFLEISGFKARMLLRSEVLGAFMLDYDSLSR